MALAVVALDGLDAEQAVAELRATAGKVLAVAPPGKKHASFSDVVSLGDEAALLARISEALAPQREPEPIEKALEFAGYRLDVAGHSLKNSAGREVPLTPREFCLLRAFAQKAGRVLSRDQLLQLTVGRDAEAYDRSVDMQILRLRRKIEPDPKRPSLIITVPGGGYKFAEAVRQAKPPPRPQPAPASAGSIGLRSSAGAPPRHRARRRARVGSKWPCAERPGGPERHGSLIPPHRHPRP